MFAKKYLLFVGLCVILGIVGVVLFLAKFNENNNSQDIQQSNIHYRDVRYDIEFDYPSSWGGVRAGYPVEGFDVGERVVIQFEQNEDVILSLFSDDFVEGITEGTPMYFDNRITFVLRDDDILEYLNTSKSGQQQISFIEKRSKREGEYLFAEGLYGYGVMSEAQFYLFPHRFEFPLRNLMIVNRRDFADEETILGVADSIIPHSIAKSTTVTYIDNDLDIRFELPPGIGAGSDEIVDFRDRDHDFFNGKRKEINISTSGISIFGESYNYKNLSEYFQEMMTLDDFCEHYFFVTDDVLRNKCELKKTKDGRPYLYAIVFQAPECSFNFFIEYIIENQSLNSPYRFVHFRVRPDDASRELADQFFEDDELSCHINNKFRELFAAHTKDNEEYSSFTATDREQIRMLENIFESLSLPK